MKKACKYCGAIHDKNFICEKKSVSEFRSRGHPSDADIFRWSGLWKQKRKEIMIRDKYLCAACFNKFPGTLCRLNNKELSVHHIVSLKTDWEKRLDNRNLITLCRMHHDAAESNRISVKELLKLAEK